MRTLLICRRKIMLQLCFKFIICLKEAINAQICIDQKYIKSLFDLPDVRTI